MIRFAAVCLLTFLTACPVPAVAGPVVVGVEKGYPPFEMADEDGHADGFAVDLLRRVAAVSGLEAAFVSDSWSNLLAALREGRVDLLPFVGVSAERERTLDFTAPVITTEGAVFVCAACPALAVLTDLEGRRVGVLRDDIAHERARDLAAAQNVHPVLVPYDTLALAFEALSRREVAAVVAPHLIGRFEINRLGLRDIAPAALVLPDFVLTYAIAVRDGEQDLLRRINGGLAALHADGTYDRAYAAWFPQDPDRGLPISLVVDVAAAALVVFALVLGWLYLRQRRFARLAERRGRQAQRDAALDRSFEALTIRLLSEATLSLDDIAKEVLDRGRLLTGSRHGFVGYIDQETNFLVCPTLTPDVLEGCRVAGSSTVFQRFTGLWGWVLTHRQAMVTNDPARDPRSTGTPPGHTPVQRFVAAPALIDDHLVGIVALANGADPYDEHDLKICERLAMVFAMALNRRRMELDLEAEHHRAEAANRTKSLFLAQMSHELRTPLNAIIGFSELIRDTDWAVLGPIQARVYAGYIHTGGQVLLSILNDVLLVSEAESGQVSLDRQRFDLATLVEEVALLFAEEARRRKLTLRPGASGGTVPVLADAPAVRRMIFNLVHNAVKFTPAGGSVSLAACLDADGAPVVEVRDTGIGIPPDLVQTVLRPFEQVDELYRRRCEGPGLGLSVVAALMRLHDGTLTIDSAPGRGTLVTLRFAPVPAPRLAVA